MKRWSALVFVLMMLFLFSVSLGSAAVNTENHCDQAGSSNMADYAATGLRLGYYGTSSTCWGDPTEISLFRTYLFKSSGFTSTDMKQLYGIWGDYELYAQPLASRVGGYYEYFDYDHGGRSGVYIYGSLSSVRLGHWADGTEGGWLKSSYEKPYAYSAVMVSTLYDRYRDTLSSFITDSDFSNSNPITFVSPYWLFYYPTREPLHLGPARSAYGTYYPGAYNGVYYLSMVSGLDSRNGEWNDDYSISIIATGDYYASTNVLTRYQMRSQIPNTIFEKYSNVCNVVGEHITAKGFAGKVGAMKCCGNNILTNGDVGVLNENYICARNPSNNRYQWVDLCGLNPSSLPSGYGLEPHASLIAAEQAKTGDQAVCCLSNDNSGGYCSGSMQLTCGGTYWCSTSLGSTCGDFRLECGYTAPGCYPTSSCGTLEQLSGNTPTLSSDVLTATGLFEDQASFKLDPRIVGDTCNCYGRSQSLCNSPCTWNAGSCSGGSHACSSSWPLDFCSDAGCSIRDSQGTNRYEWSTCSNVYSRSTCLATDDCFWKCKGDIGDICAQNKDCLSNICHADFDGVKRCHSSYDRCIVGSDGADDVYYSGSWQDLSSRGIQPNDFSSNPSGFYEVTPGQYVCVDNTMKRCDANIVGYASTLCGTTAANGFLCTGELIDPVCTGTQTCSEVYGSNWAGCAADDKCTYTPGYCRDMVDCSGDGGFVKAMVDGPVVQPVVLPGEESFSSPVLEQSFKELIPDPDEYGCGCNTWVTSTTCIENGGGNCGWVNPSCAGDYSDCSGSPPCVTGCDRYPPASVTQCDGLLHGTFSGRCLSGYGCENSCKSPTFGQQISWDAAPSDTVAKMACECEGLEWADTCYADYDGDGFPQSVVSIGYCVGDNSASDIRFKKDGISYVCNPTLYDCDDTHGTCSYAPANDNPSSCVTYTGSITNWVPAYRSTARFPGNSEVCDNLDNDCNGATAVDVGCDDDNDRYVDDTMSCVGSFRSADYSTSGVVTTCTDRVGDCDDTDPNIHPGALELCDGIDNDCNASTVDGSGAGVCPGQWCSGGACVNLALCYLDSDGDGFGNPSVSVSVAGVCGSGYVVDGTDCDDDDEFTYPGAPELCNGKDNNCLNGLADDGVDECDMTLPLPYEWCDGSSCLHRTLCYEDVDGDGHGNSSAVGEYFAMSGCPANYALLNDDCDDNDPNNYPGNVESCDGRDNDCDGVVDELTGSCYGALGDCAGVLDCKAEFGVSNSCKVALGCTEVPGRCSVSGEFCNSTTTCGSGVCEEIDCSGSVSCAGFGDSTCSDNQAYGCLVLDCDTAIAKSKNFAPGGPYTCEEAGSTCAWTCGATTNQEICSNNVDDDGINGIDCADSACRKASWTDAEVDRYNCLGTSQTGDKSYPAPPPTQYYCAVGETDNSVGLCCPVGYYLRYFDMFGVWECVETDPCYPTPLYPCGYEYSAATFSDWLASPGCLDVSTPSACCEVVQFGDMDYYSDSGNVKVY